MNKERLLAILTHIKKHPEFYDQNVTHSDCGTKHSIAGHAEIVFWVGSNDPQTDYLNYFSTWQKAKYCLDLNDSEAAYLFSGIRTIEEIEEYILFGESMWDMPMDVRRAAVINALAYRYYVRLCGLGCRRTK